MIVMRTALTVMRAISILFFAKGARNKRRKKQGREGMMLKKERNNPFTETFLPLCFSFFYGGVSSAVRRAARLFSASAVANKRRLFYFSVLPISARMGSKYFWISSFLMRSSSSRGISVRTFQPKSSVCAMLRSSFSS